MEEYNIRVTTYVSCLVVIEAPIANITQYGMNLLLSTVIYLQEYATSYAGFEPVTRRVSVLRCL